MKWQPIATVPFDRDLELAVISNATDMHALVFPCRRVLRGWVKAETNARLSMFTLHTGANGRTGNLRRACIRCEEPEAPC